MSCHLVEQKTIWYIVCGALNYPGLEWRDYAGEIRALDSPDNSLEMCETLVRANLRSVEYRYGEKASRSAGFEFDKSRLDVVEVDPVQLYKTIRYYHYQSCEHPEWQESEASRFCDALLDLVSGKLRFGDSGNPVGYDDAVWGVPEEWEPPSPDPQQNDPETERLIRSCQKLRRFVSAEQVDTMTSALRGDDGEFFRHKILQLAELFDHYMPVSGETDHDGDDAFVYLHYFKNGADWYILERDREYAQHQAFGFANLGDPGCAELGYISIIELIRNNAELDLHWEVRTLGEIRSEIWN